MRKLVLLLTAVTAVTAVTFAAPAVAQAPPTITLAIGKPSGGPQGTVRPRPTARSCGSRVTSPAPRRAARSSR
jgi:hypothetical protein